MYIALKVPNGGHWRYDMEFEYDAVKFYSEGIDLVKTYVFIIDRTCANAWACTSNG